MQNSYSECCCSAECYWTLRHFSVWRAVLIPLVFFVCETEKQLWLLSHSYSMAWFEYCFNTSSEKLPCSFPHMHVILRCLLNFKMSLSHISRLLFFSWKNYTSILKIEVTERFVWKCTLQQIIYSIIVIANSCCVSHSMKCFTFIPRNNLQIGTTISPVS